MYLTNITHDFNFEIDNNMEEIFYTLEFKKSHTIPLYFTFQSKIKFHTNQGRMSYLSIYTKHKDVKEKYLFSVKGIVTFFWEAGSDFIQYKLYRKSTNNLIKYWLVHTFLPLYFLIEKKYEVLHVGAIEIDNRACLFAAPSFGGKSTLTHHFLTKGHKLLSDDKLTCYKKHDKYYAIPSYPYARNYRALEDLGVYIENFSDKSLNVGCIYSLKPIQKMETLTIKLLSGVEKFEVIERCHDMKLSMLKEEKFVILNQMAKSIMVYEVTIPQDIELLDQVYDKVIAHFKRVTQSMEKELI